MIRSAPQPGDIGLTTIEGPIGVLVRFGQWINGTGFGMYEHAFVVLPGGRLIEAMPSGARIRPLADYDGKHVLYVAPAGLTYSHRVLIAETAAAYEGVGYSFADYLALALRRLRIPAPGLRRFIASTRHMICSQLADQAYTDAGVQLFADGRWPGWVTPGDLFQLLAVQDRQENVDV
ncbi:hypothetical protein KCMC57_64480 (plasmid) [Kitasatospora sp. CMC57]|uniref:Uncharacterized protein n=1 Tax=Kitasatospora sp. CMC57 TaxID=3231513 RepID=A0AB33KF57_9ACTN